MTRSLSPRLLLGLILVLVGACGDNLRPPEDPAVGRCEAEARTACSLTRGDERCYLAFSWSCSEEDERAARELCLGGSAHCIDGLPYWN